MTNTIEFNQDFFKVYLVFNIYMAKEYKGTVQKLLGLIGILLPIFIDLILFLNI